MAPREPLLGTERKLDAPFMTFDLESALAQLKREKNWQTAEHNAITLAKTTSLRIVLVALKKGASIRSHRAESPLSFQVVDGEIEFNAPPESAKLRKGQLLTLHSGLPHDIKALSESAFLLTLPASANHPAER